MDNRVQKVIQMMHDDVRGELSLAELAQAVNLSAWRLCHIFKSEIGMPPIKYLRALRMERAKKLLENTFLSVKEIAYRVGLNDDSHFVRDFKSIYGLSPTLYRTRFRSQQEAPKSQSGEHDLRHKHLVQIAKTILPTLNLIIYLTSLC